ncbi:hypothetical protein ACLOJK_012997 [Asimina triloba]
MLVAQCDPSASVLLSPEGSNLVSESESRRAFPWPDSAGASEDDKGNAEVPDEDPNKRRTTGISAEDGVERGISAEDGVERLYAAGQKETGTDKKLSATKTVHWEKIKDNEKQTRLPSCLAQSH